MRGGHKQAELACGRPLDGRVRPHCTLAHCQLPWRATTRQAGNLDRTNASSSPRPSSQPWTTVDAPFKKVTTSLTSAGSRTVAREAFGRYSLNNCRRKKTSSIGHLLFLSNQSLDAATNSQAPWLTMETSD